MSCLRFFKPLAGWIAICLLCSSSLAASEAGIADGIAALREGYALLQEAMRAAEALKAGERPEIKPKTQAATKIAELLDQQIRAVKVLQLPSDVGDSAPPAASQAELTSSDTATVRRALRQQTQHVVARASQLRKLSGLIDALDEQRREAQVVKNAARRASDSFAELAKAPIKPIAKLYIDAWADIELTLLPKIADYDSALLQKYRSATDVASTRVGAMIRDTNELQLGLQAERSRLLSEQDSLRRDRAQGRSEVESARTSLLSRGEALQKRRATLKAEQAQLEHLLSTATQLEAEASAELAALRAEVDAKSITQAEFDRRYANMLAMIKRRDELLSEVTRRGKVLVDQSDEYARDKASFDADLQRWKEDDARLQRQEAEWAERESRLDEFLKGNAEDTAQVNGITTTASTPELLAALLRTSNLRIVEADAVAEINLDVLLADAELGRSELEDVRQSLPGEDAYVEMLHGLENAENQLSSRVANEPVNWLAPLDNASSSAIAGTGLDGGQPIQSRVAGPANPVVIMVLQSLDATHAVTPPGAASAAQADDR